MLPQDVSNDSTLLDDGVVVGDLVVIDDDDVLDENKTLPSVDLDDDRTVTLKTRRPDFIDADTGSHDDLNPWLWNNILGHAWQSVTQGCLALRSSADARELMAHPLVGGSVSQMTLGANICRYQRDAQTQRNRACDNLDRLYNTGDELVQRAVEAMCHLGMVLCQDATSLLSRRNAPPPWIEAHRDWSRQVEKVLEDIHLLHVSFIVEACDAILMKRPREPSFA